MNDIKDCNLIVDEVLSLLNSEAFQSLRSYYDDTTIFNVMGVERSENRHSSFLCWLFSTNSSHGLGDKPQYHAFPIVIENKIYAREGVEQTKRYYNAMIDYCAAKGSDYSPNN